MARQMRSGGAGISICLVPKSAVEPEKLDSRLVYNLYDSQDLYHRFPAAEGTAYFIGGFTASYLRRGDVVLIPIRLGVGWRLGANVGYMKFTPQSKLMPF